MARRSRTRRRVGVWALLIALIVGAALIATVGLDYFERYRDRLFSQSQCTVSLDGDTAALTAEQTNNAALIAAVSASRDLPARAATIGIATAIQESSLRNIDYGDRDSVGLFQQRPSQGWGSVEQIMDPYYSTGAFYDALVRVPGWRELEITVAAQEVQRSAFPDAYAQHEAESRLWASALRGHSGQFPVDCSLRSVAPGSAAALQERLDADFGEGFYATEVVEQSGDTAVVRVVPRSGTATDTAMATAWLVSTAQGMGIIHVVTADGSWSHPAGAALPAEVDPAAAPVTVVLEVD